MLRSSMTADLIEPVAVAVSATTGTPETKGNYIT